ncbi:hypothetical protein E4U45_000220 [Claviceps purpurea]|nr:hypothetical protein E4U45_000220 [Claviceps purpurea]
MKLFTSLPLALFACHALAQCDTGSFNGSNDYNGLDRGEMCDLGPTKQPHNKDALTFTSFNVDATVYVNCNGGKSALFSCRVRSSDTYSDLLSAAMRRWYLVHLQYAPNLTISIA